MMFTVHFRYGLTLQCSLFTGHGYWKRMFRNLGCQLSSLFDQVIWLKHLAYYACIRLVALLGSEALTQVFRLLCVHVSSC
jgi:hypothetical protein